MKKILAFLTKKTSVFFIVSVVVLELGFFSNFWNIADQYWFDDFQRSSESQIIGRLAASEREGMFFKAGLLGRYIVHEDIFDQYCFYNDKDMIVDKSTFHAYYSQIGGQAFAFVLLDNISPLQNTSNVIFFKLIASLLFSIVLSLFLLWVNRKYGLMAAIIALLFFLLSHWLTVFGRNLYWVVAILYIPFITLIFKLDKESTNEKYVLTQKRIVILSFVLVLIKCFFTGFELITTVLIMFVIPLVYYAILDKWKIRTLFYRTFSMAAGSLAAIFLYFFALAFQLSFVKGSLLKGFEHIGYSFLKRTSGSSGDFPKVYELSLESTLPMVLEKYWNGTAIDLNTYINTSWKSLLRIDFGELILIFMIFSLMIQLSKKLSPSTFEMRNVNKALVITTWISLLAPLSWYVIFKGHSFIHTHTNFIAWYMPFCLFGFATVGSVISSIGKDAFNFYCNQQLKYKRLMQLGIFMLGIMVIVSQTESLTQYMKLREVKSPKNMIAKQYGFELYLFDDKLWYFKDEATEMEVKTRFFLHIIPKNTKDLPVNRLKYGFDNLDFNYVDQSFLLPWWYGNSNYLVAMIDLPKYMKIEIKTGQYKNRQIVWQTSFKLK